MYVAFLKIKDTLNNDLKEKFFTQEGYIKLNNWHKFIEYETTKHGFRDKEF